MGISISNGRGSGGGSGGGSGLLSGNGAPSNSLGSDNSFYYDKANPALYGPKLNGQWPAAVPLGGTTVVNRTESTDPFEVTVPGAQVITLPVNDPANIVMFLNGQLQPDSLFTVTGNQAFVSADLGALPKDKIEFEYEILSYSSTASNQPVDEIPVGTINGANKVFTLGFLPIAGTLNIYSNGVRYDKDDYSLNGQTLTFNLAPDKKIIATYYR